MWNWPNHPKFVTLIPAITLWDPEDLKKVLSTIITYHHGNTGADPGFSPMGGQLA